MNYNGNIYRPPIEAHTMLIPVTEGCTHNKCTFCNMYQNVPFRMWTLDEVENYVAEVKSRCGRLADSIDRVYFVGADPFALCIHSCFGKAPIASSEPAVQNIRPMKTAPFRKLSERVLYFCYESIVYSLTVGCVIVLYALCSFS